MRQNGMKGRAASALAAVILTMTAGATMHAARAEPADGQSSGQSSVQPAAAPPASPPAASSPAPCDCASAYREYKPADTPATRALFAAVRASDEAAFAAALAQQEHPGEYALEGVPLLHALLMPPRALRAKEVYWALSDSEADRIRKAYRAILPARTRMLSALLATRPALDDVTYESRQPALHLALLYGTPEIMDMLLAAGAHPNQRGDRDRTPLEFLLNRDFEFAVRMTYLPRLVDRDAMTHMVLALFKAGAAKPYADADPQAADYLAWGPLVELTEGAAPVQALAATGTRPAYDDDLTPLALAAYLGNAGAVQALMALGPREVAASGDGASGPRDAWLDAAQAAVQGGHPDIAAQLLRPGMPFAQPGPQTGSGAPLFTKVDTAYRPIMNLAAQHGDVPLLQKLLALGAPVDGDPNEPAGNTPLADAIQARQFDAVPVLLAAGADPLAQRDGYDAKSAVQVAIEAGDAATLRRFANGGLDFKRLGPDAIRRTLQNRDTALALMLIEGGADRPARAEAQKDAVDASSRPGASIPAEANEADRSEPLLLLAAATGQASVVDALLARGADPAGVGAQGESALYWLIGRQDTAMLDRLLRAGARLDDARLPRAPAPYALLNAAVASGDIALVKRVSAANGQPVAEACVPEGAEHALLDKPGYVQQLQAAGFTGKANACAPDAAPLAARIVSPLLQSRQWLVARQSVAVELLRFARISGGSLDAASFQGETPLNMAIGLGRADLAEALLTAGAQPDAADARGRSPAWVALESGQPDMLALLARHHARFDRAAAPAGQSFAYTLACQSAPAFKRVMQDAGVTLATPCPPPTPGATGGGRSKASKAAPHPAPSASAKRLAGHYFLRGAREMGSELLLSADGRFDYAMSYGAVDIAARGVWRREGDRVLLDTLPIEPYSPIVNVRADSRPAQSGQLTVRVYYRDRPVKIDVAMSSRDADFGGGPRSSEGEDGVSAPIAPGALTSLAVFVPLPAGARWHQVDLRKLDADARAIRIDIDAPDAAASTPLHKILVVQQDGSLVEPEQGRQLRYEKE